MVDWVYNRAYGKGSVYIMSGNLSGLPLILCLGFVILLFWLFYAGGIRDFVWEIEEEDGWKAAIPFKKKIIIAVIGAVVVISCSLASMLWNEKFTLYGVEKFCFGAERNYTWEDAEKLTLKRDFQDILIFQIQMKDGSCHYFNGGFFRQAEYFSDGFEEKFEDSRAYMLWLAELLKEKGVPLEIRDEEELIGNLGTEGDYWSETAKEIMKIYGK